MLKCLMTPRVKVGTEYVTKGQSMAQVQLHCQTVVVLYNLLIVNIDESYY